MDRSKLYRAVAAVVLVGCARVTLAETVSLYPTDDTYLSQSAPDSGQSKSKPQATHNFHWSCGQWMDRASG